MTESKPIQMKRRMLYTPIFHIDTNRINARGKLDAMNQLEKWKKDGVILINMSGISFKEALVGNNPARTEKAFEHIFTTTDTSIDKNHLLYKRIESTIFPDGVKDQNEENDVKIVYEAAHYQAILVTDDGNSQTQHGGILGHREALRDAVQIMRDYEAVAFVREKLAERDNHTRKAAEASGAYIPDWVGKD
jgi:hypothetical protein